MPPPGFRVGQDTLVKYPRLLDNLWGPDRILRCWPHFQRCDQNLC